MLRDGCCLLLLLLLLHQGILCFCSRGLMLLLKPSIRSNGIVLGSSGSLLLLLLLLLR